MVVVDTGAVDTAVNRVTVVDMVADTRVSFPFLLAVPNPDE